MNRTDLQQLAELRFREARSLLDAGFPDGAYYLAGYSVECALKACIAKRTREFDFPDKDLVQKSYTHKLGELMKHAQLTLPFEIAIREDVSLQDHWSIVQRWTEESRYERSGVTAAESLLKAVEDGSKGILPWIRLHW